jgi:hypothetical protein
MVAVANAGLHPCKPAPPADKHVQPLGDWAMGRKALWFGEVCRILGGHRYCRSAASYLTVIPDRIPCGQFSDQESDDPSAGASWKLFGMVGVLFVFGVKYRRELPEGFKRAFGTGLLPIILLNLAIGFVGRGIIDNAAHLGGLLSGAALASVVSYKRPGQSTGMTIAWRVAQVICLLVIAVCFFMVARDFDIALRTYDRLQIRKGSHERYKMHKTGI